MRVRVWMWVPATLFLLGAALWVGHRSSPTFFSSEFFRALLANSIAVLVGAALGVPTALWLDRAVQRERLKKVRSPALGALRKAIEHNDELVSQALEVFERSNVVLFSTDPLAIEGVLQKVLEATEDIDLVHKAGNLRFQLEHFARKLDTQYRLANRPEFWGGTGPAVLLGNQLREQRNLIVESARQLGPQIRDLARELLRDIDVLENEES